MSECDQEMCPYWTGDGCVCAVFGIEPGERQGCACYERKDES